MSLIATGLAGVQALKQSRGTLDRILPTLTASSLVPAVLVGPLRAQQAQALMLVELLLGVAGVGGVWLSGLLIAGGWRSTALGAQSPKVAAPITDLPMPPKPIFEPAHAAAETAPAMACANVASITAPTPTPVVAHALARPMPPMPVDIPLDGSLAGLGLDTAAAQVITPLSGPAMPREVSSTELVEHAVLAAQRGGEVVSRVVTNMEGISNASRQISEVLSTIDSIAFQTNLLALNAAVQAAKAGQDQRGFGAVAGEVRGLAQRAAAAAKEIKGLIHATVEKTESGARLMRDAGITMDAIVSSVQSVTELVGQIASNPGAPAAALVEADRSVQRLDQLTSQNLMLVAQSGNAADALREQAERLQKVVGAFRLLQQTQEAAWTAHTAIHSARSSSRDGQAPTRPAGLDPSSDAGGGPDAGWGSF